MIKAYWPELTGTIDHIAFGRMPASRMVSLAVRLVLSDEKLKSAVSVSEIRRIAKENESIKRKILAFIGTINNSPLQDTCRCVDKWLGLPQGNTPEWGVLKFHRTSIAIKSPDVYLVFLWLAHKYPDTSQEMYRMLAGTATLMHWYGINKLKLANDIFDNCKLELTIESLMTSLQAGKEYFIKIYSPDELDCALMLPDPMDERLGAWTWWDCLVTGNFSEKEQRNRKENWWDFVCTTRENREMLLYAQRNFLTKTFSDYDPARKDLWEDHNRPWDYDHILPNYYTYYKHGIFREFCREWCNTIGNLRACSFEENRSSQSVTADNKISSWKDSFIEDEEKDGFCLAHGIRTNPQNAHSFAFSCKKRLVRIYREWYETLKIGQLVHDE